MSPTIEGAFQEHWKKLVTKDQTLAQSPDSFRTLLRDAFVAGYILGATERQIELEAHRGN
jgi:hypothetical protein